MKRLLAFLLALTMSLGLAASFASADDEVVDIHFLLVAGNDEMPGWQGIVDAFNEDHTDIHVTLEQLPGGWAEYIQKLTTLIAAGSPPDVGRMGVAYMAQFASKGQLADLTELVEQDLDMSNYYENAFEQIKIDGKIYGIPIGIYTMIMFYNKDMFDAAGIEYPSMNWDSTWTLDEFVEIAKQLTSGEGLEKNYGFYANFDPERAVPFIYGMDADYLTADHKTSTINDAAIVSYYNLMQEMIYSLGIAPTAAQAETMSSTQMFMAGRLAMLGDGQWQMPSLNTEDDYNYGAAPIPGGRTNNFIDQYVIFEGSTKKEAAWEVVKSFIDEKAENIMVDNSLGGIPINKNVAQDRIEDLFDPLPMDEKLMMLESVDYSKSLPFTANWAELMDVVNVYTDLISLNEMSAQEALDAAAEEMDTMLK